MKILNISEIISSLKASQGFSFNVNTLEINPSHGYMVAIDKESEFMVSNYNDLITNNPDKIVSIIRAYIDNNKSKLTETTFVGGWIDNDILYLDLSEILPSKALAIEACINRQQLAYFDNSTKEAVFI